MDIPHVSVAMTESFIVGVPLTEGSQSASTGSIWANTQTLSNMLTAIIVMIQNQRTM